ncbi:MAG: glycosyltransferase [Actinomycetota bacterium]
MRILLWHGWLLEGSGSNVYTARVAEVFRAQGHDVTLLCQEAHAERYRWIDATGTVDAGGVSALVPNAAEPAPGRCVLLRPRIGPLLPVFVVDEYEGFEVKRFVDLTHAELTAYLEANVGALRAAAAWQGSEATIAGHAIPGGVIARRALGPGRYVTKIHGSDLEYAIRLDARYRALADEGLSGGIAVTGSSDDVLRRCLELVPGIERLVRTVSPGVDVNVFRPRPRVEALLETALRLDADRETVAGRPARLDADVARAIERRDPGALDALAAAYDQEVPDPDAAARLRRLTTSDGPVAGYFGKLIPQKGVANLLLAARAAAHRPRTLVVGFGTHREWLQALALALRAGEADALAWVAAAIGVPVPRRGGPADPAEVPATTFTGRLDHRYAPGVLAAMDVLVVPSILEEAFGIVTVEGAAAGALPLVARHSGLAEVADAIEADVGRPGLLSFEPGPDAARHLTQGLDTLLGLEPAERRELRDAVAGFVGRTWSWRRTAERLLDAASDGRRT